MIELLNEDCMAVMARYPDKHFDLCICDPPYGIGMDGQEWNNTPTGEKSIKGKTIGIKTIKKNWDNSIPGEEYFKELRRVSRDQIIWGANYMTDFLPAARGWICWDKLQQEGIKFSKFQLAWTSFNRFAELVKISNLGGFVAKPIDQKIHPTQKPVKLYDWLLHNYAKPGQRVLDTHLGSGSSAIAAHYYGVEFVGCELDKEYYDAAVKRFAMATAQTTLFEESA
jgi:site-specific DNA-methyltransferase (adenine-specific)